jgi:hypothetical protein
MGVDGLMKRLCAAASVVDELTAAGIAVDILG